MAGSRPLVEPINSPAPAKLLTMYDLPSEDPEELGLPDEFHDLQPQLLSATLRLTDVSRDRIFTGTDLNHYKIGRERFIPLAFSRGMKRDTGTFRCR